MYQLLSIKSRIRFISYKLELIKPFELKSSTRITSAINSGGAVLKTLWTVRISVDQPSFTNTITTLAVGSLLISG